MVESQFKFLDFTCREKKKLESLFISHMLLKNNFFIKVKLLESFSLNSTCNIKNS